MTTRLPSWFRQEIPRDVGFIKNRLKEFENSGLNTVCLSARCPNINRCFEDNSVTFMIMGSNCSRNCGFCAVDKGRLNPLDLSETYNLALTINRLNLSYVVITSVTRDDLPFGGASQYARAVYLIKKINPGKKIELLIPDFRNQPEAISLVVKSCPDIIAHNLETVESLYQKVRPLADYRQSLEVLRKVKNLGFAGLVKSGIMLGFGELREEVIKAIRDLRESGCDILTLGQYLAPSERHIPVEEFITPEQFESYRQEALELGFKAVYSGPLVRSSFHAREIYSKIT
ncbi:MAG: lipoyl synthase [Candidatus Omnitrophota bacterium]|nr:lipoyl synthase [Candidatus Omnitrophota bacterium]